MPSPDTNLPAGSEGSVTLPLRYRVPNPPPHFTGRGALLEELGVALGRGPLTLVVGPPGIGKTALVSQLLAAQFPEQLERSVYVPVRRSTPPEDIRIEIGRALFRTRNLGEAQWRSAVSDIEALSAVSLDLAETADWWVVIDDAQLAEPSSTRELASLVRRYARRSKWVLVSSRKDVGSELSSDVVDVGAMSAVELRKVAAEQASDTARPRLDELVASAAGSPWKLIQQLAAARAGVELGGSSVLEGLPSTTVTFLKLLAIVGEAVPKRVVTAVAELPAADVLAELERRGLVEVSPAELSQDEPRFRLHEMVREGLEREGRLDQLQELHARAAGAFAQLDDPDAHLTALRLYARAGRDDALLQLLDARGQGLLDRGYGRALWQLVQGAGASTGPFARWRLLAAVEAGSAADLATLEPPPNPSAAEQLLWGRVLFNRGRIDDALKVGHQLQQSLDSQGTEELRSEAEYLVACCHANVSRWEEAVRALDGDAPAKELSASERVKRDLLALRCLTLAGHSQRALERLELVQAHFPELEPATRKQVGYSLAVALYELGRGGEGAKLLDSLGPGDHPPLYSEQGRYALFQRATLAHLRGDVDESRELLATLWPFVGSISMLRPHVLLLEARLRYYAGELEGLENTLGDVIDHARRIGSSNLECMAENYRLLLDIDAGRHERAASRTCPAADTQGLNAQIFSLRQARATLRAGSAVAANLDAVAAADFPKLALIAEEVRAEASLVAGDAAAALVKVEEVLQLAERSGMGLAQSSLRTLRCEALVCLGRRAELEQEALLLRDDGESTASPRTLLAADFYLAVARTGSPDMSALASVAAGLSMAPPVARRARALFNLPCPIDAVDQVVVDGARRFQPWSEVELVRGPAVTQASDVDWQRAWGLVGPDQRVWLPQRRSVDLSRRDLLWRLLCVVADHGGEAHKEQLVVEAWGEREYHPLRHDNRLQAAVRKLRRAIEDDPSSPTRFVPAKMDMRSETPCSAGVASEHALHNGGDMAIRDWVGLRRLSVAIVLTSALGVAGGCSSDGDGGDSSDGVVGVEDPRFPGYLYASGTVSKCGEDIYYESWTPIGAEPEAVWIWAGGYTEYTDKYHHLIPLIDKPWKLVMFDHRGQGRSSGPRIHVEDFNDLICDTQSIVDEHKIASKPLFMNAHSLGGAIITMWAVAHPDEPDAMVFSAPMWGIGERYEGTTAVCVAGAQGVKSGAGEQQVFPRTGETQTCMESGVTHDCDQYDLFAGKDIVSSVVFTFSAVNQACMGFDYINANLANLTSMPILLFQAGEDFFVDNAEHDRICGEVNDLGGDCSIKRYEQNWHEHYNELNRAEVMAETLSFFSQHL